MIALAMVFVLTSGGTASAATIRLEAQVHNPRSPAHRSVEVRYAAEDLVGHDHVNLRMASDQLIGVPCPPSAEAWNAVPTPGFWLLTDAETKVSPVYPVFPSGGSGIPEQGELISPISSVRFAPERDAVAGGWRVCAWLEVDGRFQHDPVTGETSLTPPATLVAEASYSLEKLAPGPLLIWFLRDPREGRIVFGGYNTDTKIGSAISRFGPPATRTGEDDPDPCTMTWPELGATFFTADFGPGDCSGASGRLQVARLTGTQWRTTGGLKVGDPASLIRRRHPSAFRCDNRGFVPYPRQLSRGGDGSISGGFRLTRAERAYLVSRCRKLSSGATGRWWLAPGFWLPGTASFYSRLVVRVVRGRITAFEIDSRAAGD